MILDWKVKGSEYIYIYFRVEIQIPWKPRDDAYLILGHSEHSGMTRVSKDLIPVSVMTLMWWDFKSSWAWVWWWWEGWVEFKNLERDWGSWFSNKLLVGDGEREEEAEECDCQDRKWSTDLLLAPSEDELGSWKRGWDLKLMNQSRGSDSKGEWECRWVRLERGEMDDWLLSQVSR